MDLNRYVDVHEIDHEALTPAVIVDLDGTLVNVSTISHLVRGSKKNFPLFQELATFCPANLDVVAVTQSLAEVGFKILIFSGRSDAWEHATKEWLEVHRVPYSSLSMRPAGDFRPDWQLKLAMLTALDPRMNVVLAIDDRPQVIRLWRSQGIPVVTLPWDGEQE